MGQECFHPPRVESSGSVQRTRHQCPRTFWPAHQRGSFMKLILWDFDGTLAFREEAWTGTILNILQVSEIGLGSVGIDDVSRELRTGFPWHDPFKPHTEITNAEQWWAWVTPYFEQVFANLGCSLEVAQNCARLVRPTYLDRSYWKAFADVGALGRLAEFGWTHWILSNHVPELKELVRDLGLATRVTEVLTSALTGYEKPHPQAYRVALDLTKGLEAVWMVGDNLVADYRGVRDVGIPSVLVRNYAEEAEIYAENLWDVAKILEE